MCSFARVQYHRVLSVQAFRPTAGLPGQPDVSSVKIIRSKLHRPRVIADLVVRGDLLARLEAGSNRPLTLLSAPAGFGKTSLVSHWLESRDGLAAWLSLDREDSDPVVFVCYVVAAVRTVLPDACAETLSCLQGGQRVPIADLAAHLSNDLDELRTPLALVLDDYQHIESPETHALLDRLLMHPATALRLVLLARQDPPLSLGALRAREEMSEIRMRDLQFCPPETAALLERCTGHAVAGGVVAYLQKHSEGWPLGVRMAALRLRQGGTVDALGHCLSGSTAQMQQYFNEQAFAHATVDARDGLLATSILERFCGPLCAAVLDERVARAKGHDSPTFMRFVSSGAVLCFAIDDRLEWYRYHRLFREFLQQQLRTYQTAAEIAELHRRAAAWFESEALIEEAIPHALAGSGAAFAGQLLVRHGESLLGREKRHRLARCLSLLPPDAVDSDPELLLLRAWLLYHQGRHVETTAVLDRIEVLIENLADGSETPSGSVLALRSLQRYIEGRAEVAVACAEDALRRLAAGSLHARVLAQAVIASALQMRGDLPGARQWIQEALARSAGPIGVCQPPLLSTLCFLEWMAADLSALQWLARQNNRSSELGSGGEGNLALAGYFLGLVQYQRNELALAEATLLSALDPQHAPCLGYRTEISFVLAAVYQALGQADRAREIVDRVCEHLRQNGDSPALFRAEACRADLALRQGRMDEAREWARNFDPGPVQFVYRFSNAPHLTLARVWIAEGSTESCEQASRLLQVLEAELASRHNTRYLIEVLALQALLQRTLGDAAAACERLGRAVQFAQPGGFIRLFVDLGQDLLPPLKRLDPGEGSARYLAQILAAFNDDWLVSAGRQQVGADLTRRELKILKLLAVRLSNVEISEELCISRATVKRHTQNIYRKLRASSRREAVIKARTLNILADG